MQKEQLCSLIYVYKMSPQDIIFYLKLIIHTHSHVWIFTYVYTRALRQIN